MIYTLEPDRAREMVINLIRRRVPFSLDQEDTTAKDVRVIGVHGDLVERAETHDYARRLTCTHRDEATHFALNAEREGFSFTVRPTEYPDGRCEWSFTLERHRAITERRRSRVFG